MRRLFERPLKEYSSGMQARLAFAISIHSMRKSCVVDEILGVGDAAFQKKCHAFQQAFRDAGRAPPCSCHNDPGMVSALCAGECWLEAGHKKG